MRVLYSMYAATSISRLLLNSLLTKNKDGCCIIPSCDVIRSGDIIMSCDVMTTFPPRRSTPSLPSLSHSYETLNGSDTAEVNFRTPLRPAPPGREEAILLLNIFKKHC